jgi:predicted Rossmann-fold nucleotide-binding protein
MRRKSKTHVMPMNLTEDVTGSIRARCTEWGVTHVIAFSGGADASPGYTEDEFKPLVAQFMRDILGALVNERIAVLCGGTKWGVPKLAAETAKEFGFPVIGMYPDCGAKHALSADFLDFAIQMGPLSAQSFWGDETPIFATLPDAAIIIGGGAGTLVEVSHMLKINESLVKDGSPRLPIRIIPWEKSGGVAAQLRTYPMKDAVRAQALPSMSVETASDVLDALQFLFHA